MPTAITLSGFKEFEAKIAALPKVLQQEINLEVGVAADEWASLAKEASPIDVGFLRGLITAAKTGEGTYEVISGAEYSAYVEWGTRTKVRVPADLQAYASQFKGGEGEGTGTAKSFIFAWCKRKGIAPQYWYPIYRSIMINGINPHPFFFIQKPIIEKQLLEALNNIIKNA